MMEQRTSLLSTLNRRAQGELVLSTILVEASGVVIAHPWLGDELAEDLYSLFMSRSELMAWSSSGTFDSGAWLWGMNDARLEGTGTYLDPVAWVQVGLPEPPVRQSIPISPLFACLAHSLALLGAFHLESVRITLTEGAIDRSDDRSYLFGGLNSFMLGDPSNMTAIEVHLVSGDRSGVKDVNALLEQLQWMNTDPFKFGPMERATNDQGSPSRGITLLCTAPDWTLDALAFVTGIVLYARSKGRRPSSIVPRTVIELRRRSRAAV